jgi:hypothetical protein
MVCLLLREEVCHSDVVGLLTEMTIAVYPSGQKYLVERVGVECGNGEQGLTEKGLYK